MKRIKETFNLRNEADIQNYCKFLYLITSTPSFLERKEKEKWQEGKIKSIAIRHHMENFVCKNHIRIDTEEENFKIFEKEFYNRISGKKKVMKEVVKGEKETN